VRSVTGSRRAGKPAVPLLVVFYSRDIDFNEPRPRSQEAETLSADARQRDPPKSAENAWDRAAIQTHFGSYRRQNEHA
jgi:hypothetical protein